jgi:hypothetical protein
MENDKRKYFKFRYRNRLYTRKQARELGRTFLSNDSKWLFVFNENGFNCIMYLQRCARGQKYVEEDKYLRDRDRFEN